MEMDMQSPDDMWGGLEMLLPFSSGRSRGVKADFG